MYVCSICKTPTAREGRCESCGWVKTLVVKEDEGVANFEQIPDLITRAEGSIVFFTEDTQHITGGRYYSWWLATALQAAGFDVIIYTNRQPIFIDNFKDYPQPTVRIVPELRSVDVVADMYFGSPVVGNEIAIALGERYGKPTFCEIFDPFPMMEKYRGDHQLPGWNRLLTELRKPHVKIISLCKTANEYIYPWLGKRKDEVFDVYPCINSKAKATVKKGIKKRDWAVFVSRLDHHKKIGHVMSAVRATDLELHIITSIDGVGLKQMARVHGMEDRIVEHFNVSDEEKFEIIRRSKVMINGAIFEGFGIWLAEAIACGVPSVCYDYETFKEIKEYAGAKNVYFAEWNDADSLTRTLQTALMDNKQAKDSDRFDFERMVERVSDVVGVANEPRIGVVQIVLNEEDYVQASLRSVIKHPNVAKVAVVEGAVNLFAHAATQEGFSIDKTREKICEVIKEDVQGKIIFDRYGWAENKAELRNRALKLLTDDCNYVMVLDGDEVWKQEDLDLLVEEIKKRPSVSVWWYPAHHFWKQPDQVAVGSQWDNYLFRFFKYIDKSLHWGRHETPVVNAQGTYATKLGGGEVFLEEPHFYHYGAMKPEQRIKDKLKFYAARDKHLHVKNTWSKWKKGQETQWTHGGGTVKKFEGTHPEEVGL